MSKFFRRAIPALLLLCSFLPASGSEFDNIRFENSIVNAKLSSRGINHIMQDSKGFVWIATHEGLNCYDGYTMRRYLNNAGDSTSLVHDFVRYVFEDASSRIWVCTEGGVCSYDPNSDRFRTYTLNGKAFTGCHVITQLSDGTVITARGGRLHEYDPASDEFRTINEPLGPPPFPIRINSLCEDADGILWMGTNAGVRCFDIRSRKPVPLPVTGPHAAEIAGNSFYAVRKDRRSRIWICQYGVFVYDPQDGLTRSLTSSASRTNVLRTVEFDSQGNAWIGGENGIDIYDAELKFRRHIAHNVEDISNLNDNAVYTICKDRSGNMWVGTYFGGVNVMYIHTANFSVYPAGHSRKHLSGKAVREIIENDDHSLWIATEDGGLNLFDRRTRNFRHFGDRSDEIPVSYHNIHCLLKDSGRNLWIGSFSGGITRYDLRTKQAAYLKCRRGGIEATDIFALMKDRDGDIWIGTSEGLFVNRQGNGDRIENVRKQFISTRFIHCLACDRNGTLWIGTRNNGLFRYDKYADKLEEIPNQTPTQTFVTTLFVDKPGNVWAGTNNGGLRFFDHKSGQTITYTTQDGLPSNSVKSIVQDNYGYLWLGTSSGLSCFDPDNMQFINYTVADGLPDHTFNYNSAFKASNGELFFGTTNGMISFFPHTFYEVRDPLNVEITDFRIHGQRTQADPEHTALWDAVSSHSAVTLTNRQASSFSFTYTAINFSHAANIHYAVKMSGADSEWHDVENQHQVFFSNLRSGKYTLGIKASYNGSTWDEEGARYLDIEIKPPFYLSGWAYAAYFLFIVLGACATYAIIRTRMKMTERINAERMAKTQAEEMNLQKMHFFANISHDLKTPLTLIVGPLQKIVGEKSTDKRLREKLSVVLKNTQRMRNLLDKLLLLSKIEMGYARICVQQGDVLNFIDNICDIFRIFASDNGINFIVNIDYRHKDVWFSVSNTERIVYNLLSNAFKFTPPGGVIRIKAELSKNDEGQDILTISVKDNGAGIPPEQQEKIFDNYYSSAKSETSGTGIGLALTKSLVSLHHGTVTLHSAVGKGSVFSVRLNVSREAYVQEQVSGIRVEPETALREKLIQEDNEYLQQARIEIQEQEGKRFHILIVEDNRELRDFVRQLFERNFDISVASDGKEGYETAMQLLPDLIISDVMMPEMDGFEMTRQLKSNLTTSHIPVVLLTAKTQEDDKIEGFETGADAYIAKPFNNTRLELQVRNLLNTRQNNMLRFKHNPQTDVRSLAKTPHDEKFMERLVELIMSNLDNDQFSIKDITDSLSVSRSFLHIKLKNLADLSATEFIRTIKMKEARKKLLSGMNVSETSFAVGISDPNYFSKCFKKQFGQTPTEFLRSVRKQE